MDYQSTYFLVIAKPPVEYKRVPIFCLPEKYSPLYFDTVPFILTEHESH